MQYLYYTVAAIALYFGSDWIRVQFLRQRNWFVIQLNPARQGLFELGYCGFWDFQLAAPSSI